MSDRIKIIIVDYGMGNLRSIKRKLNYPDLDVEISSNAAVIASADKLILPGVGHFAKAMDNLQQIGLIGVLNDFALVQKKPVLGICLGMQLMAKHSEEGDAEGLGWFDAEVVHFSVADSLKYKVPHMGWNQVTCGKKSALFNGIESDAEFYFVHSYHMQTNEKDSILNTTNYEYDFTSGIEKGNIYGVQYHPEKSHDAGIQLLNNFIAV